MSNKHPQQFKQGDRVQLVSREGIQPGTHIDTSKEMMVRRHYPRRNGKTGNVVFVEAELKDELKHEGHAFLEKYQEFRPEQLIPVFTPILVTDPHKYNRILVGNLRKLGYRWEDGRDLWHNTHIKKTSTGLIHVLPAGVVQYEPTADVSPEVCESAIPDYEIFGPNPEDKTDGVDPTWVAIDEASDVPDSMFQEPTTAMEVAQQEKKWDPPKRYEVDPDLLKRLSYQVSIDVEPKTMDAIMDMILHKAQITPKPLKAEANNTDSMGLQKISKRMKRVLNKNLQAQYRAGYIDRDLHLTRKGANAVLEIVAQEYETQLAKEAQEEIDEKESECNCDE